MDGIERVQTVISNVSVSHGVAAKIEVLNRKPLVPAGHVWVEPEPDTQLLLRASL